MSGKRSRFFRKQNTVSKKLIALTLATALAVMPMSAEGDVSVTIFPHFMKSLSVGDTHDINGGYGAGVKLSYAPNKYMDLFVEGDYLNLTLPNVDPITVMNGNVGIEYKIPISDRINLGVSAEAGGYKATYKADMTGLTGGASLSLSYKFGPTLSSETKTTLNHYSAGDTGLVTSAMVSPGLSVNLTEALQNKTKVKVNTKSISPVFPVLHSWYNDNSFATIEVKNEEDYDIEQVTVSFFQPLYMSQPKVCAVKEKVGKEESFDTDITAFFNERMLDLIEKTDTQATVTVKYVCLGKEKTLEYPMTIPVYDRNSMSWDDDRRAAAFVSSKDPAAMWYAKYISSIVHDNMRSGVAENIQYAMGIFETLDKFGLNYVIDPSSSYADNIGTASIDFLQFPYQTLMYRGGDCDDISILVCSLFEAVGIDTAFITIPGHIFMAFNSGLTVDEAKKEFSSMENFIVRDNEVWVPLEITLTDEGFNKAWRVGAREWNQADKNGTACLYKMRDSWKTYKPVSVPGAAIKFTMLEDNKIADAFETGIVTWINHEISPMANEYKTAIAQTDSDEIINSLGALYARYGLFVKADDQFKKSRRRGYLPSLLNTANMYFSTKDYELALKWYKKVLETEPDNMLATLGVARCCYELELYDECDAAYAKIRSDSPQLAADYSYLGAFENKNGRSFSLSDRLGKTIWVNDFLDMREYDKTTLAMTEEEETASEDFSSNTDLIPPEELLASLPQGLLRPDSEVQPTEDKNTAVASAPKTKTPEDFGGEIFVGLVNEIAIRNTEKENYEESHSIESHIPLLVPDAQIAQSEDEESTELAIADTQEELEIPNPNVYESFDAVATSNEHSRHDDDDEKLFTSIPITSPKTKSETYIAQALDEPINEEPVHEEDSKPLPAEEFELATAPHTTEKPETEQVAVTEPIVKPQEIALANEPVNAEPTYQTESAAVSTDSINTPRPELATAVEPAETPQIAVTEPVTPDSILGKDEMFEGDEGDSPKTQLTLADAPASTAPTYQSESAVVSTESINTPQTELAAAVEPLENSRLASEAEPAQQVAILPGKKDETLTEESESVNPLPFELPPDMPLLVPDAPILDTPQQELATAPHTTEKPETEQVAVAEPIVKPQEIALASEPVNAEPTYQTESAQVLTGSINTPRPELATAVEPVETPQIAVTEPVTPDSILGKDEMFEGDEGDSPKTQLALADAPASTEPTYQTESAQVSTGSINTPQTELATALEPAETPQIAVTEPVTPDSILGKDEMFEGDEGDSPKTQLALADAPASTEPTYQTESAAVSTESIPTPQTELAAAVEPLENSRLTSEAEPTEPINPPLVFDEFNATTSYATDPEVIAPVEIPRFTRPPSAEWAPEEAYTEELIPGMKSFEEEMKISGTKEENSNKVAKIDPNADFDVIEDEEETEEIQNDFLKMILQQESETELAALNENNKELTKNSQNKPKVNLKKSTDSVIINNRNTELEQQNDTASKEKSALETIDAVWDSFTNDISEKPSKKVNQENDRVNKKAEKSALETIDEVWDGFSDAQSKAKETSEEEKNTSLAFVLLACGASGLAALFFIILLFKRRKDEDEDEKKGDENEKTEN